MTSADGNLKFKVASGKRIGYQIGTEKEVLFKELANSDTEFANHIQAAFRSGVTAGDVGAKVQCNSVSGVADAFGAKVDNATKPLEATIKSLGDKVDAAVKPLADKLKGVETKLAQAAAASDPVYWTDNHVGDGEEVGKTYVTPGQSVQLKLSGVGFKPRYHPNANSQMACKFTPKDKKLKTADGVGSIVAHAQNGNVYYHVECPTPAYPKGAIITVSLSEHAGKAIPFIGCPTCNTYLVDAVHESTKMVGNYPKHPRTPCSASGAWAPSTSACSRAARAPSRAPSRR